MYIWDIYRMGEVIEDISGSHCELNHGGGVVQPKRWSLADTPPLDYDFRPFHAMYNINAKNRFQG